jgi:hypothetical protein
MFSWLEVHHMDVEVIVSSLRDELAQLKHFPRGREQRRSLYMAVEELWFTLQTMR